MQGSNNDAIERFAPRPKNKHKKKENKQRKSKREARKNRHEEKED